MKGEKIITIKKKTVNKNNYKRKNKE